MRKIVFKTIFITLGVVLILAISAFGILSFAAPKAMMSFTSSLGLDAISGDYAYQEYRRSGDIEYLARAFEIAAFEGRSDAAAERFEELYENEGFSDYCKAQDGVELARRGDFLFALNHNGTPAAAEPAGAWTPLLPGGRELPAYGFQIYKERGR